MSERRVLILLACSLSLCACDTGERMIRQPSSKPYHASDFFDDGKMARTPPPGSIPREHAAIEPEYWAGRPSWDRDIANPRHQNYVERIPIDHVTSTFVARGRDQYDVFCTPCHGPAGAGDGEVTRWGFPSPPTYHQPRLRNAPDGYIYRVISEGYGLMYGYEHRIRPWDRWAIVAYVRALQLSRHATLSQAPEKERRELEEWRDHE